MVVIFTEDENTLPFTKAEGERLAQEFLQRMHDGFALGGGDYPKREGFMPNDWSGSNAARVDTNIFVYAHDISAGEKHERA